MAITVENKNDVANVVVSATGNHYDGKDEGFTEGDREAGYIIEFDRDGVFLTVYPTEDGGIFFEMDDMQKILDKYRTVKYDIVALAKIIRKASGQRTRLSEYFDGDPDSKLEGMRRYGNGTVDDGRPLAEYHFEISKDKMSAALKWDVIQDRQIPPVREVIESMQRAGIVYGIDEDHLRQLLPKGTDFIAARGTAAVKGEDAHIERYFDLSQKGKAVSDNNGRVDFKNLQLFVLVKKGDILARRIPHTAGITGKNVLGEEIHPKPGKPRPVPSGKNTRIQNENDIVAEIDGQVVDSGNMISVDSRFEVSGNVDVSTGNIEFDGSVHISGDVEQGFTVKATGDVEIGGAVAGGSVEGNNIYINGGVQGMNGGKVIARGNISASFAENAELEAGRDIHILDVALHSTLIAGGRIVLEGKRGVITGGAISAGEEIRAQIIGNAANVITKISVGQNPMLQREYKMIAAELVEDRKRLDAIKKNLGVLEKIDIMKLPKERIDQINKLTRAQFPLAKEIKRKTKRLEELDEEIVRMGNCKVRVRDTIHAGVRMSINSVLKYFQTSHSCCSFYADEDVIKTGPY